MGEGGGGGRVALRTHTRSPSTLTHNTRTHCRAYAAFDKGVARKFVIDPHGTTAAALGVKHATV